MTPKRFAAISDIGNGHLRQALDGRPADLHRRTLEDSEIAVYSLLHEPLTAQARLLPWHTVDECSYDPLARPFFNPFPIATRFRNG